MHDLQKCVQLILTYTNGQKDLLLYVINTGLNSSRLNIRAKQIQGP